jgi:hypothetical protein
VAGFEATRSSHCIGEIQFRGLTCVRLLCTPLKTISTVQKAGRGLRTVNVSAQQVHASHKAGGFANTTVATMAQLCGRKIGDSRRFNQNYEGRLIKWFICVSIGGRVTA